MIDIKQLARLVPMDGMGSERLQKLASEAVVEDVKSGTEIFKEGDQDNQSIYLLAGEIELVSKKSGARRTVTGGSDEARYALSNLKPRQFTGVAKSAARLLRVDSVLMDSLLAWDQTMGFGIEVEAQRL